MGSTLRYLVGCSNHLATGDSMYRPEFSDTSGAFIETLALNLKANYKTIVKQ